MELRKYKLRELISVCDHCCPTTLEQRKLSICDGFSHFWNEKVLQAFV